MMISVVAMFSTKGSVFFGKFVLLHFNLALTKEFC